MNDDIEPPFVLDKQDSAGNCVPPVIARVGQHARRRFLEFFTAHIRNRNTRLAYAHACGLFLAWCDERRVPLERIEPMIVAAYVESLMLRMSPPTVKQHLAAIRMLFDWLVVGQVLPMNPAGVVRGPTHVVKKGKTPVLSAEQARLLLDRIALSTSEGANCLTGLRDRALIGVMIYTFARVGAVVAMNAGDYWRNGKRWFIRLHEKGGRQHELIAHHNAEAYLDAYLHAAGIGNQPNLPLFRTCDGRSGRLTVNRLSRHDALRMIKRRAAVADLPLGTCCHTFRATGITAYLSNGGTLEHAQRIAAHESSRTTSLYDRRSDDITLDEIERIIL